MADGPWFYAESNTQRGPVSTADLQQMAQTARIGPETLVWCEGMPQWAAARTIFNWWSAAPMPAAPAGAFAAPAAAAAAPLSYISPTDFAATQQFQYAGFWLRFCAWFIDRLVVGLPFFFFSRVFFILSPHPIIQPAPFRRMPMFLLASGSIGIQLVESALRWLYFALMESSVHQATLGKMAMGLKVTDAGGLRISFARATGRYFAKFISDLTLCIGYMMAGWTARKQALHDMIASTLVLRKR